MQYLNVSKEDFSETIRLAHNEPRDVNKRDAWSFDIFVESHDVRRAFSRDAKEYDPNIRYRPDTGYPVLNLTRDPGRYVIYRGELDPFDDDVVKLPRVKDFAHTHDILDLHRRTVLEYRYWSNLTAIPALPILEHKLILKFFEQYLLSRLPIEYVKQAKWDWYDDMLKDYLRPSSYQCENPDVERERLVEYLEEMRFYLLNVIQRLDDSTSRDSPWLTYRVTGAFGRLSIETLGDYRIFDWRRLREPSLT